MSYLNLTLLIGYLGEDPVVLKREESGCFVRLSLATNKKYTNDKGEIIQDTRWHSVYLSNGVGEFAASNLKKGDEVFVLGELRMNQWKDKQGQFQYIPSVYAKECKPLTQQKGRNLGLDSRELA